MSDDGMVLGALGSDQTFNGLAATELLDKYSIFSGLRFFPTSKEAFQAAVDGKVDATCAPERSSITGPNQLMFRELTRPGSELFVLGEVSRIYHCSLLGKPGATVDGIRRILGHDGSVAHSKKWIDLHLPGAEVEVVTSHSTAAAGIVLNGDGSIASIGSRKSAEDLGLVELAENIDSGSRVRYWAISRAIGLSENANRLVVAGRCGPDGSLTELVTRLGQTGFSVATVTSGPSGDDLDSLDYLLTFVAVAGVAGRRDWLDVVERSEGFRLAGAIEF
jgi:prephenate dehydratase